MLAYAAAALVVATAPDEKPATTRSTNILVVYSNDVHNATGQLAWALSAGASAAGSPADSIKLRTLEVEYANYKRDVIDWGAAAVVLGSGTYNGNADAKMIEFIDSFDFNDDLGAVVGSSFATAGAAAAGLQPVLNQLSRGLQTFGMILIGGASWESSRGTGAVVNASGAVPLQSLVDARAQGAKVAKGAAALRRAAGPPAPSPSPPPSPGPSPSPSPPSPSPPSPSPPSPNPEPSSEPPPWGSTWSARISANLTQPGYDAGLVIVNFTTSCPADPLRQKMITVYGDFYTVLTRCDLGHEFTIAPKSRGGGCLARKIGVDVSARICQACSCPFCTRDTNGTYTHGRLAAKTAWTGPQRTSIGGKDVIVWRGLAESDEQREGKAFALTTDVAFQPDGQTPVYVNVSHPLWVQTAARVDAFTRLVDPRAWDVPAKCPNV